VVLFCNLGGVETNYFVAACSCIIIYKETHLYRDCVTGPSPLFFSLLDSRVLHTFIVLLQGSGNEYISESDGDLATRSHISHKVSCDEQYV